MSTHNNFKKIFQLHLLVVDKIIFACVQLLLLTLPELQAGRQQNCGNINEQKTHPTLGSPTMPHFRLVPMRPIKTGWSDCSCFFFGGILTTTKQRTIICSHRNVCIKFHQLCYCKQLQINSQRVARSQGQHIRWHHSWRGIGWQELQSLLGRDLSHLILHSSAERLLQFM